MKLCLLFLLTLPVSAAGPWNLPLFTSDPRAVLAAALSYPSPEGLDAITIDYSVQVQLDDSGKMHTTTRTVERVIRLQGIQGLGQVSLRWIPWRENRPKIKARVITSDGKPHLLDEASVTETDAPGGPQQIKVLSAEFPAVDIDSVIEVETEQSDRESADPEGRWGEIPVISNYLIAHFSAAIETASGHTLRVEPRGFRDAKKSLSQVGGVQQVKVEEFEIVPGQNGVLLPPDQTSVPTIDFSNVPSWQGAANWFAGVLNKALPASGVTSAPAPSSDAQLSAIERIFEDIQKKVKSTGLALGVGPYAPQRPTETLTRGSGDPEDKAVLLITKLAEIGIPAKAALVRAGTDSDVLRSLPGIEGFNRMLVYVPGQHPLWIDPDAEFTPVSRIPLFDQNRWALIVDSSATDLVRTPETTASDNRETATTEIQVRDGNEAKVNTTIETFGAFEDLARPVYADVASPEEMDKRRTELVQRSRVSRISNLDTGEPRNLLTPYSLRFAAEGYAGSVVTDAAASVDLPGPASISFQQLGGLLQAIHQGYRPAQIIGSRKIDYYVPPAFTEDTRYHVIPPSGYRVTSTPASSEQIVGPLRLSSTIKAQADGSVEVDYRLTDPKSRYTTQEMSSLLQDFQKLQGKASLRIVFTNGAVEKIAGGELKDGIELLRRDVASAPSDPSATLRLATAYVQAGVRAEALKLCEKALSVLDPPSKGAPSGGEQIAKSTAAAYARLGWVYTHDEFGRQFRPGMNIAEAEKAYLKAIQLDPEEQSYAMELATLYTYNFAGIHFGRSARLDDALQKFRQVGLASLEKNNALNQYAMTLVAAKRYDEVKELFLLPQGENVNPAFKLAAIAATSGGADVREEAEFIAPAAEKRAGLLVTAAQCLLSVREYQPASILFQMVRVQTQGVSGTILAKVRIAKEFTEEGASRQPAVARVQHFVEAVLNPADFDEWKKQVVPETTEQPAQWRSKLFNLLNGASTEGDPSSWPIVSDILTTTFKFVADGGDATGYRIRAVDSTGKTSAVIAYVVKRGSEYLVLGLTGSARSSGEAFSRVESGDLTGAHQWLDWAKDESPVTKSIDPMGQAAFQRLWPARAAAAPEVTRAAAAILAARSEKYQLAISALQEMRERTQDPDLQTAIDQGLAEGFLHHERYADAVPALERLRAKSPNSEIVTASLAESLTDAHQFPEAEALIHTLEKTESSLLVGMRLEQRLLVEQGKLKEAAELQARICANPKATGYDFNDLAWIGLFAQSSEKSMRDAADKAAQMTQSRNASVLQTAAVVQASTGMLSQARSLAYRLMDEASDPGEMLTVFGLIAEKLDLRDAAAQYYLRVKKPEGNLALSNYAFAQMRLKELSSAVRPDSVAR